MPLLLVAHIVTTSKALVTSSFVVTSSKPRSPVRSVLAPRASLLLVVSPGAPFVLLVVRPGAPFVASLLLVAMPFAPSSFIVTSSKARSS